MTDDGALTANISTPEVNAEPSEWSPAERALDIRLTPRLAGDLALLAAGGFHPLAGFMDAANYDSVLESMRLRDGSIWPIPITLPLSGDDRHAAARGDRVRIVDGDRAVAAIQIDDIYRADKVREALAVYGTDDSRHPGVAQLFSEGELYVAGPLLWYDETFAGMSRCLAPAAIRGVIAERGWRRVVGFQTRNPIHRAHEHLIRLALEMGDGVLIHPLVGGTKESDVPAEVRWRCYEALVEGYLPRERVLLSGMPGAMRYAGPKEALLHLIIRRNYGCTDMIIGRDHAGVGGYYDPMAAQRLAASVADEIGIRPLFFEETFWCRRCDQLASARTCAHPLQDRVVFSGSWIRDRLQSGGEIPAVCSRPEIVEILRRQYGVRSGPARRIHPSSGGVIWLTGISGAGKSTLAGRLASALREAGARVEILDGDQVRPHLSKGLGFSRGDRDENIRRIGYVASMIAAHGVWTIVAAISPYAQARAEARASAEVRGLSFVEVYVRCPLDIAEQRDPKGLYRKARAGEIQQFTAVSDPYEEPARPDLSLETHLQSPEECVQAILAL